MPQVIVINKTASILRTKKQKMRNKRLPPNVVRPEKELQQMGFLIPLAALPSKESSCANIIFSSKKIDSFDTKKKVIEINKTKKSVRTLMVNLSTTVSPRGHPKVKLR